MAFVLGDRARETLASAPGTGNITTAGATQGAQSIASVLTSNGDTTWATIDNGTAWETTLLTRVSATVYSRAATPFNSSNAGALVNFASGTIEVFIDLPSSPADALNLTEIVVASAATTSLGAVQGAFIELQGTTGITSFGTTKNKERKVRYTGAGLTITNSATLLCPGGINLVLKTGDTFVAKSDNTATPIWQITKHGPVNGFDLSATIAPQGRLTLQTLTPVMSTTQSAKTTIYYTPYNGNLIPIYDGTNMVPMAFSELSVLTTDTTKSAAAIGAGKVNDWFIWNDSGTLRIGHGPDWTSDTARSAGTALVMVNGILLNNATITNGPAASRGTYVGTTRSNGSSQLDWIFGASGTAGFLGVWNAYNRADVRSTSAINSVSWTYNSGTVRESNNSATARTSFVTGLAEDGILASHSDTLQTAASAGSQANMGLQIDATNSFLKQAAINTPAANVLIVTPTVSAAFAPQLGFHFIAPVESTDTTICTFYGLTLQAVTVSLRA